jgi:hypothetical protein
MWTFRKRRHHPFRTIPRSAEKPILRLARQYPLVGQQGLQHEVERMGIHVDPHELKLFLRDHGHFVEFPQQSYHSRRPGQWDTGWPTWTNRNPAAQDQMGWPEGEPFETRFPFWGWSFKQPRWFRLLIGLPTLVYVLGPVVLLILYLIVSLILRLLGNDSPKLAW